MRIEQSGDYDFITNNTTKLRRLWAFDTEAEALEVCEVIGKLGHPLLNLAHVGVKQLADKITLDVTITIPHQPFIETLKDQLGIKQTWKSPGAARWNGRAR